MELLVKHINHIFSQYKTMHDEETIEDMILNSILILIIEACGLEQRHFCAFTLGEVHRIKSSNIYIDLKEGIPFRNWMEEDILVLSYEYIVGKREKKEKYGIYYTPRWLVKYIVDRSVEQNIFNMDDIRDIKILEPACGSGIFILYLFDVLYNWYTIHNNLSPEEAIRIIVENNIYGVDVDTKGINLCKYSLMIKIIRELGYMPELKFNLDNGDFLKGTRFEDLKFDYIIGNPPYLENRRINKYFDKKYLKDRFKTATGRFDIFSIFIEKALELLSEGGRVAYVLPATLLTNNNFTAIRSLILQNSSIYEITNLGEGIFNNVDMNMAIIILIKAKNQEEKNKIFCNNIVNSQRKEIDILVGNYREIPQNYYLTTLNNVFDIDSSLETFDIRNKIFKQDYVKMNDICEVIAGIATGNVRDKLLSHDSTNEKAARVLTGKDISSFYHKWSGLFIIDDKSVINREQGEYATFMRSEFIDNEKILIRQTADRFICTYDDEKLYILNTLYSLVVRESFREQIYFKYVLALLNSKFNNFLYKTLVREEGKLFPQLKIFHIQNSPIKIVGKEIQEKIVAIVNRIINKNKILNDSVEFEKIEKYKIQIEIEGLKSSLDKEIYKIFNLSDIEIIEIEREMGQCLLDYKEDKNISREVLIQELTNCDDIIKVSTKFKINPEYIYNVVFGKR